ncbi:MAG TPA: hypothetical protein VK502_04695 [Candidatus Saccharimonadales bacterium]|nr:hypothetical protein [Candidatus Saccharimonadales bacterium]
MAPYLGEHVPAGSRNEHDSRDEDDQRRIEVTTHVPLRLAPCQRGNANTGACEAYCPHRNAPDDLFAVVAALFDAVSRYQGYSVGKSCRAEKQRC